MLLHSFLMFQINTYWNLNTLVRNKGVFAADVACWMHTTDPSVPESACANLSFPFGIPSFAYSTTKPSHRDTPWQPGGTVPTSECSEWSYCWWTLLFCAKCEESEWNMCCTMCQHDVLHWCWTCTICVAMPQGNTAPCTSFQPLREAHLDKLWPKHLKTLSKPFLLFDFMLAQPPLGNRCLTVEVGSSSLIVID